MPTAMCPVFRRMGIKYENRETIFIRKLLKEKFNVKIVCDIL